MTRCTFKKGQFNCGSYAFNLYKEDIEQGQYCDHHYWQDQAQKARADERNKLAAWMIAQGYATGHGDTTEDLLKELEWHVRESEREACAKVCDELHPGLATKRAAEYIRAREKA